ncbi:MAG: hypothetical protein AB7G93_08985 [Bdellovibrionales bacterium]
MSLMYFFIMALAHAEYRAFELLITDSTTGQERVVVSNLDPRQYRRYYHVKPTETVTYTATWRCPGHTGYRWPICPKPVSP